MGSALPPDVGRGFAAPESAVFIQGYALHLGFALRKSYLHTSLATHKLFGVGKIPTPISDGTQVRSYELIAPIRPSR